MGANIPVKNIVKVNWMLATIVSLFNIVFLFNGNTQDEKIPYFAAMSFAVIACIGFSCLYLRLAFPEKTGKGYFTTAVVLSYLSAPAIEFLLWPVFAWLAGAEWKYTDLRIAIIFVCSSAMINTLVLIMHNFIILQQDKMHVELENSMLKTAHAEAANLLLKQQIHPHFLFNTLNTLKSLYRKSPQRGEEYLMHLADFLRAAVSDDQHKISTLKNELDMSLNYLNMQRIRFGDSLSCEVNVGAEVKGYVPSFSIQPLIENAIKHNDLTEAAPLRIYITAEQGWIEVSNNIQIKKYKEPSTGHGLANLAERYRIWSGDDMLINQENGIFSVKIKIKDHADSHN